MFFPHFGVHVRGVVNSVFKFFVPKNNDAVKSISLWATCILSLSRSYSSVCYLFITWGGTRHTLALYTIQLSSQQTECVCVCVRERDRLGLKVKNESVDKREVW